MAYGKDPRRKRRPVVPAHSPQARRDVTHPPASEKPREVVTEAMVDAGQAPIWALRMVRLAPGLYADRYGNVHISQAEVCRHFRVPATKENLATVVRAWNDACRAQYGTAPPITEVNE